MDFDEQERSLHSWQMTRCLRFLIDFGQFLTNCVEEEWQDKIA